MKGTTMALLALGATATTDLAAAECELTLPQGKGHCSIPSVAGLCCTALQAGMDNNKGAMMQAFKGMKGSGGKARVNTCISNMKGDMALIQNDPTEYCTKGEDVEEFPDFLALGAAATADLAAAECELTLPQGKGHCSIPSVAGLCCTALQAGMDNNKGAMMQAFKGMKGSGGKARVNTCISNMKGDMALLQNHPTDYCTKGEDVEEFPDFLALSAAATADLAAAECELTLPQGQGHCSFPSVAGQCCTLLQAAMDHNKEEMNAANEGLKSQGQARVNTCINNMNRDVALLRENPTEYCTKGEDVEEFPDFLALGAAATADLIEAQDDASEDGSQIVTGLLGFVAGATVAGLGAIVLRRRTPSQDEYNQIVA